MNGIAIVIISILIFSDSALSTKLHDAVSCGDLSKVQTLLAESQDLDAVDERGNTALHIAAERGLIDILTALVDAGVKKDILNHAGLSAFEIAVNAWQPDTVQALAPDFIVRLGRDGQIREDENLRLALHELGMPSHIAETRMLTLSCPISDRRIPETIRRIKGLANRYGIESTGRWDLEMPQVKQVEELILQTKKLAEQIEILGPKSVQWLWTRNRIYRILYDIVKEARYSGNPQAEEIKKILKPRVLYVSFDISGTNLLGNPFDDVYLNLFLQLLQSILHPVVVTNGHPAPELSEIRKALSSLQRRAYFFQTLVPLSHISSALAQFPDSEPPLVLDLFKKIAIWIEGIGGIRAGLSKDLKLSSSSIHTAIPWTALTALGHALLRHGDELLYQSAFLELRNEAKGLLTTFSDVLEHEVAAAPMPTVPPKPPEYLVLKAVGSFHADREVIKTIVAALFKLPNFSHPERDKYAVLRIIEIVGESFKNISPIFKERYKDWETVFKSFSEARDFFAHLEQDQGWGRLQAFLSSPHYSKTLKDITNNDLVKLCHFFKCVYAELLGLTTLQKVKDFYANRTDSHKNLLSDNLDQMMSELKRRVSRAERAALHRDVFVEQEFQARLAIELEEEIVSNSCGMPRSDWEKKLAALELSKDPKGAISEFLKGNNRSDDKREKVLRILRNYDSGFSDTPKEVDTAIDLLGASPAWKPIRDKLRKLRIGLLTSWKVIHNRLFINPVSKRDRDTLAKELLNVDLEDAVDLLGFSSNWDNIATELRRLKVQDIDTWKGIHDRIFPPNPVSRNERVSLRREVFDNAETRDLVFNMDLKKIIELLKTATDWTDVAKKLNELRIMNTKTWESIYNREVSPRSISLAELGLLAIEIFEEQEQQRLTSFELLDQLQSDNHIISESDLKKKLDILCLSKKKNQELIDFVKDKKQAADKKEKIFEMLQLYTRTKLDEVIDLLGTSRDWKIIFYRLQDLKIKNIESWREIHERIYPRYGEVTELRNSLRDSDSVLEVANLLKDMLPKKYSKAAKNILGESAERIVSKLGELSNDLDKETLLREAFEFLVSSFRHPAIRLGSFFDEQSCQPGVNEPWMGKYRQLGQELENLVKEANRYLHLHKTTKLEIPRKDRLLLAVLRLAVGMHKPMPDPFISITGKNIKPLREELRQERDSLQKMADAWPWSGEDEVSVQLQNGTSVPVTIEDNTGGGECLFLALNTTREQLAERMVGNYDQVEDLFVNAIAARQLIDVNAWYLRMTLKGPNGWGGDFEIGLFTRLNNVRVAIFQPNQRGVWQFVYQDGPDTATETIFLGRTTVPGGEHYVRLIPLQAGIIIRGDRLTVNPLAIVPTVPREELERVRTIILNLFRQPTVSLSYSVSSSTTSM